MRLSGLGTMDFRTLHTAKGNISYIHDGEESLIYALKKGEKKLSLKMKGYKLPDDFGLVSEAHSL